MPNPVPGSGGNFKLLSDESLSFGRNPVKFVEKKIAKYGPVFSARVVNRDTVFVASQAGMQDLMLVEGVQQTFGSGYKDIMENMYGSNCLLLMDGDAGLCMRQSLQQAFTPEALDAAAARCRAHVEKVLEGLEVKGAVELYPLFRDLAIDLSLILFLDLDDELDSAHGEKIRACAIDHWRGLVTLQSSVSPQYRKASAAREALRGLIAGRMQHGCAGMRRAGGLPAAITAACGEAQGMEHLLLLVSALVPKAISSVLTSWCLVVGRADREEEAKRCALDPSYLAAHIREVERLWPPFFGGFRVSKCAATIANHDIPAGQFIMFATRALNRDPAVFQNPDEFMPSRWDVPEPPRIWTYGGGMRECVGRALAGRVIRVVAEVLLERYVWQCDAQDPAYKWLPVARPQEHCKAQFQKRQP